MSINDQVAGWEPVAVLRCEKIHSTQFLNKADLRHPNFKIMAQIFPLHSREQCREWIGGVAMTTLRQIELRCPVCDNEFKSQSVVSTNAFGGKRTDFHERAAGTQPLAYLIHMCSECGYSGGEADFTSAADVSPVLKQQVFKELAPLRPALVCGSEKYEAAAKVAQWQGTDPRHVADLLLRAAWCCVDEGDVEAERYYRRHAAWMFEEALKAYDGVPREERAILTYLVGELWRRIGDTKKAAVWFEGVAAEVTDQQNQQWVVDAADQQRLNPREWFG
jgi:uncharacterized protein (DUF2225 family)